jgi:hypothetical protein
LFFYPLKRLSSSSSSSSIVSGASLVVLVVKNLPAMIRVQSLHWDNILEEGMATHSNILAQKIPWTEEPGGLQPIGSLRVGYNCVTSLSLFTFRHWRRKWQPTPVFLPGESQGRGSLVGCRLWGRTESLKRLSSSSSSSKMMPSSC